MENKLDSALSLARQGFLVFPIRENSKAPPLIKDWPTLATTNEETIRQWWLASPNANIGIHCKGMVVVDVDPKKGGDDSFQQLEMIHGFPDTFTVNTPSGGSHIYYRSAVAAQNGVDALGRGVDLRSDSGYVVAPGSETETGRYTVEQDRTVADVPDWLVQKLGTFTKRERSEIVNIPDADEATVERAASWLQTAERSIKGSGGDQAAYRVACALRDFGLSYGQACEAMRSATWDYGCGWRDGYLEDKPIRSAYRYATGEPGSKAAVETDFPILSQKDPQISDKIPVKSRLQILSAFAGKTYKDAGYVVKGLFQRRSYAEVYGAPGQGKTFVALDIAYHVAANAPWMKLPVHGGTVLYLAFEGTGGLVRRAQALRQHYGQADVPLYVVDARMSLREQSGRAELGQFLGQLPEPPVMVFIDTFARALVGGDENSAQDVGQFNGAIAALIEATGACVTIIHHSGKDASKGARGSSALLGALDTEIQIADNRITSCKQRDVELASPIGFKLVPIVVGVDADGDEISSCVVEPAPIAPGGARLTGNAQRGFDALCILSPNNQPVHVNEWLAGCRDFLGTKSVAQRFYDLKRSLMMKGYVSVDEQGLATRRMT